MSATVEREPVPQLAKVPPAVDSEPDEVHEVPHVNGAAPDVAEDAFPETEPDEREPEPLRIRIDWEASLLYKQFRGKPTEQLRPIAANVTTILDNDERWSGVIAYDEFATDVVALKEPPWRACDVPQGGAAPGDWTPDDLTRLQTWLSAEYGMDVAPDTIMAAVNVVAKRRRIHPVKAWLESIRWDGKPRLPTWLVDVMGVKDTPYARAIGTAWAVSAIARIYAPGCKVDTVLVLEGNPGTFKSSVLRALVGDEWFFEMSVTDVSNKDAMQILRRKWIAEFPEIDSLQRYEQAAVKSYFSRQVDRYRPSFGKAASDFPRQVTFAATTNKRDGWITDETGGTGRRMLPIWCNRGDVDCARAMREQFWAEARARFESGERWHFTDPALVAAVAAEQAARLQADAWEPIVAAWLEDPKRWEQDEGYGGKPIRVRVPFELPAEGVTTAEVLEHGLEIPVGRITKGDTMRAASVLRAVGCKYVSKREVKGVTIRRYGNKPAKEST